MGKKIVVTPSLAISFDQRSRGNETPHTEAKGKRTTRFSLTLPPNGGRLYVRDKRITTKG